MLKPARHWQVCGHREGHVLMGEGSRSILPMTFSVKRLMLAEDRVGTQGNIEGGR